MKICCSADVMSVFLINDILVILPISHLTQVSHSNSNLESSLENQQNETGEIIFFSPVIAFPFGTRLIRSLPLHFVCVLTFRGGVPQIHHQRTEGSL